MQYFLTFSSSTMLQFLVMYHGAPGLLRFGSMVSGDVWM
jgi:hypothetical protein